MQVESGSEPSLFTSNFLGWEDKSADVYVDPYEAKLAALREEKAKAVMAAAPVGRPSPPACTHPAHSPTTRSAI